MQFELKEMKRRQEAAEEEDRQRRQAEAEAKAAQEAQIEAARQAELAARDAADAPGSPGSNYDKALARGSLKGASTAQLSYIMIVVHSQSTALLTPNQHHISFHAAYIPH